MRLQLIWVVPATRLIAKRPVDRIKPLVKLGACALRAIPFDRVALAWTGSLPRKGGFTAGREDTAAALTPEHDLLFPGQASPASY
jgi:hypothetical protein